MGQASADPGKYRQDGDRPSLGHAQGSRAQALGPDSLRLNSDFPTPSPAVWP